MSIVKIFDHDESIYKLKKRPLPPVPKPATYQSKFQETHAKEIARQRIGKRLTFGYAEVPLAKPSEYLKKNASEQHRHGTTVKCDSCSPADSKKSTVPPHTVASTKKDPSTNVDFVHKNVADAMKLVPKQPQKLVVDTRYGHKYSEETEGKAPTFRKKPGFGKLPEYIIERQERGRETVPPRRRKGNRGKASMNDFNDRGDYCLNRQINTGPKYVCADERLQLLLGLKHNWADTMKQYQLLPIITDTPSKVQRKLQLEKDLHQLEKDIAQLEKHPVLYVVDTNEEYHSS